MVSGTISLQPPPAGNAGFCGSAFKKGVRDNWEKGVGTMVSGTVSLPKEPGKEPAGKNRDTHKSVVP